MRARRRRPARYGAAAGGESRGGDDRASHGGTVDLEGLLSESLRPLCPVEVELKGHVDTFLGEVAGRREHEVNPAALKGLDDEIVHDILSRLDVAHRKAERQAPRSNRLTGLDLLVRKPVAFQDGVL